MSSVGGKLESFYYAFGSTDVFFIADLPDNTSAASLNLVAAATGSISSETVVLLTPEEIDAATKKSAAYRPPGG
jgi:uncharacterized protein with GYD domain